MVMSNSWIAICTSQALDASKTSISFSEINLQPVSSYKRRHPLRKSRNRIGFWPPITNAFTILSVLHSSFESGFRQKPKTSITSCQRSRIRCGRIRRMSWTSVGRMESTSCARFLLLKALRGGTKSSRVEKCCSVGVFA